MIIWLASYPRSGNTLLRMMLYQVFGCRSCSKYYDPKTPANFKQGGPVRVGGTPLPAPWPECYSPMALDPDITHIVKTHDHPEDDAKALYVVRNGLAAIRSYKHYCHDIDTIDYSLDEVIMGEPFFGSWGCHLDAWNPVERPKTLRLKYEDLMDRPDKELQRIAEFTGFKRQAEWVNNFEELRAFEPKVFREGPGPAPEHGFTEIQQQLFWALHGDWMRKLGYTHATPATLQPLRKAVTARRRVRAEPIVNSNPQAQTADVKLGPG